MPTCATTPRTGPVLQRQRPERDHLRLAQPPAQHLQHAAVGAKVSWLWRKDPGKYEIKLNGAYEFVHFKFKDFTDVRTGDKYAHSASILQLYVTGTF